jgi:hypothetical protein
MKLALEAPPVAGATQNVTVLDDSGAPIPGATVRVAYRSGLDGAREMSLGITDGLGRVRWPIDGPGRVELLIADEVLPMSVAAAEVPWETVTLLSLLFLFSAIALVAGVTGRRVG